MLTRVKKYCILLIAINNSLTTEKTKSEQKLQKGGEIMELNIEMFKELFDTRFKSYAEAGRQLNVAPAQIFRIMNRRGKAGALFFGKLYTYCNKHKLKFEKYIFLSSDNKEGGF